MPPSSLPLLISQHWRPSAAMQIDADDPEAHWDALACTGNDPYARLVHIDAVLKTQPTLFCARIVFDAADGARSYAIGGSDIERVPMLRDHIPFMRPVVYEYGTVLECTADAALEPIVRFVTTGEAPHDVGEMLDWVCRYDERILGTALLDSVFRHVAARADFSDVRCNALPPQTLDRICVGMNRALRRNLNDTLARIEAPCGEARAAADHAVAVGARVDRMRANARRKMREPPVGLCPPPPSGVQAIASLPPQRTQSTPRFASLRAACDAALAQHAVFCRRVNNGGAKLQRITFAVSRDVVMSMAAAPVNIKSMREREIFMWAQCADVCIVLGTEDGALVDEARPHVALPTLVVGHRSATCNGTTLRARATKWAVPAVEWNEANASTHASVLYEVIDDGGLDVDIVRGVPLHVSVIVHDHIVARDIVTIAPPGRQNSPQPSPTSSPASSPTSVRRSRVGSAGSDCEPSPGDDAGECAHVIGASGLVHIDWTPSERLVSALRRKLALPALARAPEYTL